MASDHENCSECVIPDDLCNAHEECILDVWSEAIKFVEEKFNSALRQPTKQGSEPSEILNLLYSARTSLEGCNGIAEFKCIRFINSAISKLLPC